MIGTCFSSPSAHKLSPHTCTFLRTWQQYQGLPVCGRWRLGNSLSLGSNPESLLYPGSPLPWSPAWSPPKGSIL